MKRNHKNENQNKSIINDDDHCDLSLHFEGSSWQFLLRGDFLGDQDEIGTLIRVRGTRWRRWAKGSMIQSLVKEDLDSDSHMMAHNRARKSQAAKMRTRGSVALETILAKETKDESMLLAWVAALGASGQ